MSKIPSKCPICGGRIVKEYFGTYGRVHLINKNGSVSKRYRNVIYDTFGEDESLIYCRDCNTEISKEELEGN